jgi:hypothetical protein
MQERRPNPPGPIHRGSDISVAMGFSWERFPTAPLTLTLSPRAGRGIDQNGDLTQGGVSPAPAKQFLLPLPWGEGQNEGPADCIVPAQFGAGRIPSEGGTPNGDPRAGQPFMPVRVMPWMKYFWAKKKMMITGAVIIRLPAIIMLIEPPAWTLKA